MLSKNLNKELKPLINSFYIVYWLLNKASKYFFCSWTDLCYIHLPWWQDLPCRWWLFQNTVNIQNPWCLVIRPEWPVRGPQHELLPPKFAPVLVTVHHLWTCSPLGALQIQSKQTVCGSFTTSVS